MSDIFFDATDRKALILLVDDVPKNLQVLAAVLYQEGYEIAMADRGKAALELMENVIPDLILLDIMMPEMDGFEVCQKIKSNPKTENIPVIFLTARHETETIVKGFELGAADYLTKPFNAPELISRVKTQIQLKHRTSLLVELNAHLEEKVKERTMELEVAYQKLSKLDVAKNYFLGLLSHELNTPLNEIKGFAFMLKNGSIDEDTKEYADFIMQSAERLIKFAEMSMLITSLKSDKYEISKDEVEIHSTIHESVFTLADFAQQKNIKIITDLIDDDLLVKGDFNLLKKSFDLVLSNSIKYCDYNKEVIIKTRIVDNFVKVDFIDSGNGFSEKSLENIFELFNTTELLNHKEGLGLGLATSKFIIDYHSGIIEVGNNQDKGAYVTISLPLE